MQAQRKVLICGLGSIGRFYVGLIKKEWPNTRISILRSGFGEIKKEELLAENIFFDKNKAKDWAPDFCIVSTPAPFHLDQALFFGREHIPLLIEKPIGIPFQKKDKWKELISLSNKTPIHVGYVLRQDPCLKLLKSNISNNLIGKVIEADFYAGSWLPNWREGIDFKQAVSARKELGGGVLLELSHEIDLALWIFGHINLQIAFINNSKIFDIDVEDQAYLLGSTNAGTNISWRLNFCSNIEKRVISIIGTNGEIICDIKKGQLIYNLLGDKEKKKKFLNSKEFIFRNQLEIFFDQKNNSGNYLSNVHDGLAVLKIIEESLTINKLQRKDLS